MDHANSRQNIMVGDTLWINVPQEDVPEILQLDGYSHAGAPISIDVTTDPMPVRDSNEISSDAKEIKEKLTAVLARRYSPEQRLLDLSTLGTDEILSNIGTFDSKNVARKAFRTLLYIAEIEYKDPAARSEAIQAVSIASNDIDDVKQVFALATSLPDLKRLDLSNNKIDSVPKLAAWQGRLKNLEELHLAGNPIVEQADYAAQLLKWFPSLQILNGQAVRTPEEVALARRAQEPTPLPTYPSNLRDGDNNIASEFVSHFFAAYDDDRARLAAEFYDQESWFSLSVIPTNARNHNFKAYMKYSRDIQSLGPRDTKVVQRLFTGGTLIGDLWKALPATRHPRLDDTSQWIVDCHTFPHLADPSGQGSAMGLFINVHGRFEEADQANNNYGTRTFSRVFILAPSKPVPPPPHPYRVISDQLTLHDWVPAPSPPATSAPVTLNAPVVSVAPPAQVPIAPVPIAQVPIAQVPIPTEPTAIVPDDNMKAQFLQELSKRTGMTAEYSQMCLDTSGWNFEAALKLFEEKRAELPAEAFIPGSV